MPKTQHESMLKVLTTCTEWPKKLYIFQHTETDIGTDMPHAMIRIKRNGFHQNVPRVSGNKD